MNDKIIKNACKILIGYVLYYSGLLYLAFRLFAREGLYIFNYHSFNTFINHYFKFGSLFQSGYKENFERQVRFYQRHFVRNTLNSFDIYLNKRRTFLLTFDDGYRDNFDIALPILEKYSIPAIIFITTGIINTDQLLWHDAVRLYFEQHKKRRKQFSAKTKKLCKDRIQSIKSLDRKSHLLEIKSIERKIATKLRLMMNWQEVIECSNKGVLIAPHTKTHPILLSLSRDDQESEIKESIEDVRNRTGKFEIKHFAVPDGKASSVDRSILNILVENGIQNIYLTEEGVNSDVGGLSGRAINVYKRIGICPSDPIPILLLKIIRANIKDRTRQLRVTQGA